MLFVVHALDKKAMMPVRAKHYRDHRIHLDKSAEHGVDVVTAGTLVADDGAKEYTGRPAIQPAAKPSKLGCVECETWHPSLKQEISEAWSSIRVLIVSV